MSAIVDQLLAWAAVVTGLSAALLTVLVVSYAQKEVVGSRTGWMLVAAGLALFSLRIMERVMDGVVDASVQALAGGAAAVLFLGGILLLSHDPPKWRVVVHKEEPA